MQWMTARKAARVVAGSGVRSAATPVALSAWKSNRAAASRRTNPQRVVLAESMRWASTSCTVQPAHREGCPTARR